MPDAAYSKSLTWHLVELSLQCSSRKTPSDKTSSSVIFLGVKAHNCNILEKTNRCKIIGGVKEYVQQFDEREGEKLCGLVLASESKEDFNEMQSFALFELVFLHSCVLCAISVLPLGTHILQSINGG